MIRENSSFRTTLCCLFISLCLPIQSNAGPFQDCFISSESDLRTFQIFLHPFQLRDSSEIPYSIRSSSLSHLLYMDPIILYQLYLYIYSIHIYFRTDIPDRSSVCFFNNRAIGNSVYRTASFLFYLPEQGFRF